MRVKLFSYLLIAVALLSIPAVSAFAGDEVSVRYDSQPDDVVLYLGDLVYARDTVTLPPGDIEVTLPPNVIADSLIVSENGARVSMLRFHNRNAASMEIMLDSRSMPISSAQAGCIVVTWSSVAEEDREVVIEYLMRGAGWRPVYDMTVIDEENVLFNFSAEITDYALTLEDANVRLLSGIIISGDMGVSSAAMTVAQNALGYQNVMMGDMSATEQVSAYHVYDFGTLSIEPGDIVRAQLVGEVLGARRIIAWDTRQGNRTEVIYKVANSSAVPFAEGNVRTYQDGVYMGSDAIEWTPSGSEGSVTVAGMSDVRVRRQETVQEIGEPFISDRRRHDVTLEVGNYSSEDIKITVLDTWLRAAIDLNFSDEPTRQPGNILRWDLEIGAGKSVTITYTFIID